MSHAHRTAASGGGAQDNDQGQPDKHWFKVRLAELGHTQRALAKVLDIDPAAVTLMLQGKRKIELKEAVALARLLDVSVEEILERVGVDLRGVRKPLTNSADTKPKFRFCPHCGEKLGM